MKNLNSKFFLLLMCLFSLSWADEGVNVNKESGEYLEAIQSLQTEMEDDKSSEAIKRALEALLSEGKDVAEALLQDEEAATLKTTTKAYPYALLVDAGYRFPITTVPHFKRLEKEELPEAWQNWFIDKSTDKKYVDGKGMHINFKPVSMWATVFKSSTNNEIVLVLRGAELRPTNYRDFSRNAVTVGEHWLGQSIPMHFIKAFELAKALKEKYPDKELVIAGSSLGGALSLFAGLALDARVYAFNSLGLNAKELEFIGKHSEKGFTNAQKQVTLVSISGDMVSDSSDMLPKSFTNSHFGTVVKIPFYDDSWTGYYGSNHHTSDAILKSMELFLKKELAPYAKPSASSPDIDPSRLPEDVEDDEFKIVNNSGGDIRVLVFSCTNSSGFGVSTTFCDQSMFRYPHTKHGFVEYVSLVPAQSKIPGLSVALSDKPVVTKNLVFGKVESAVVRIPKPEKMSWPKDYFTKNRWLYVAVINPSANCRVGQAEPYSYIGTPFYSGNWPSTWAAGKTAGWILPESKKNPKVLMVSHYNKDICSYEIKGL